MAVKTPEIIDKVIEDEYALYNADCMAVMPKLRDESVGFSIYSPPFASLYAYSDDDEDFGNCTDYDEFFTQYGFLAKQLFRVLMPGRVMAVHCMDLPTHKSSGEEIGMRDFSGDIIRLFQKTGFVFHSRHCIWKDPLVAATRTKAIGLAHKQIVKDSALCRMGIPDYLLAFRKPGINPKPIKHRRGLTEYHGSRSIPTNLDKAWSEENITAANPNPYEGGKDKRSHWIWQQYASPVWFDIRQTDVLPFREGRDADDQRHICPLQLQVIERCMTLWSAEEDIVLTPFMGVGSEVYVAVKNGRKGVGVELKPRYYRQAVRNVRTALAKTKGLNDE